MFDNLGTAITQAIGFLIVFGFFVYQLLTDGKKIINNQSKFPKKKANELKVINNKPRKMLFFGKKNLPIKEEVKPEKKGLFGRKSKPKEVLEKPNKNGWFK